VCFSVADPGCLSRIPDPRSRIPDLPDLGSQIQNQQQKRGMKQNLLSYILCFYSHKFHKNVNYFIYEMIVDASAMHVGACLQQQLCGRQAWQPLGFFSKKYSALDRKLFAFCSGICHFRHMPEDCRFNVYTDNMMLISPLAHVFDP
jgi:hypothetical protein